VFQLLYSHWVAKHTNEDLEMKSNAIIAFDNYILWLKYSPCDYEGATLAASDFIDTESDLNELEILIKSCAK